MDRGGKDSWDCASRPDILMTVEHQQVATLDHTPNWDGLFPQTHWTQLHDFRFREPVDGGHVVNEIPALVGLMRINVR